MLSIIIPVYNGEKNIEPLLKQLEAAIKPSLLKEIVFVDDKSTDGSLEQIIRLSESGRYFDGKIGWIALAHNKGQQAAVLCGLRHCTGEYAVTIDDDLEHPPELIPTLFNEIQKDHLDAVYAVTGTGSSSTGSFLRDLFFTVFLRKPSELRIGSYRILSRKAVDAITAAAKPFVYVSAELFQNGCSARHISYISSKPRQQGRYSLRKRLGLYVRLFYWYAIRRYNKNYNGPQYEIVSKGGCL